MGNTELLNPKTKTHGKIDVNQVFAKQLSCENVKHGTPEKNLYKNLPKFANGKTDNKMEVSNPPPQKKKKNAKK